ncbi:ribonuclease P protein component [Candidatus Kaiserbacteria bacterium]|nr:ribonuclease P protein component [Candidatus Kaiserbacteria bacterium]
MFKKSERLNREDFSRFFKIGKRYNNDNLTIVYNQHPSLHVAVVVGKKVSKHAVRRNKIKRRIYARLQDVFKVNNQTGVFIVVVKPGFNSLTRAAADEFLVESIAPITKSA